MVDPGKIVTKEPAQAMNEIFVISNQHGHYWGKSREWVDGSDARALWRSEYRDDAVNTLVELSARDITLRGRVDAVPVNPRGEPLVSTSECPLPERVEAQRPDTAEAAGSPAS
jgi:hypothetical protein